MKMPSTPFSLVGISFLALFVTDVYSEKVLDVSKGSTAVLRPDLVEAEVTSITWKHGDNFAADWYGRSVPFYRSFKDRSSLGTKTGELIIHDVKLEDGGVYTPEINHKTLAAVTLRVFSPVPKPSITHDCNPEQTKCILSCMFDRMDEMGNIEIFWILDSRREKGGRELHITKETKEKTFICRLNNSVSSESSTELQNPFWTDDESVTIQQIVSIALGLLIFLALLILILCLKISRERNETKPSKECKPRLLKVDHPNSSYSRERTRTMLNEECEQTLLDVYQLVLDFFNKRNPAKPYEESDLTLLKVYQMISRIDRHVTNPDEDVKKSLLNDSNRPEPDENPDLASSSETRPDPDTKTDEDAENLNKDPSEVNHETGSGSAENDPPETE